MFSYVLPFFLGVLAVQQLPSLPSLSILLVLSIIPAGFAYYRYWRIVIFLLGVIWAIVFSLLRLSDRLPLSLQGQLIAIEGRVTGLPDYDDRKVKFDFLVTKPVEDFPKKIRLSWYFPKEIIKTNQTWALTVKLKRPHGLFNPHGFDYEKWLFTQNIGATGYIRSKPKPELLRLENTGVTVDEVRQFIADQLDRLLVNSDNKGIIKALTIGDKKDLSEHQWAIFRDTGTVHLLAISGLHIGLVSGFMYVLMWRVGGWVRLVSPQSSAAVSAMLIALLYAALAGFSLPTQRSLIMLVVAMVTLIYQRKVTVLTTLSLAVLAVLMVDPLVVLSASFWLSFAAVIIIVYSLAGRLGKINVWVSTTKVHCITALGLSPLLLFYFQQVSIISPVANFIAVPVVSFVIVPLCLLAVMLMPVSLVVTAKLLFLIDELLQWLEFILSKMAVLPYATMSLPSPSVFSVLTAVLGILILLAPRGLPVRWLGFVFLLPMIFMGTEKISQKEFRLTLLDVGQGLSAVIETAEHVLVFDTGAKYSSQYDMGSAVITPYLKRNQINVVDLLVVSHADNDHIGGTASVLEQNHVKKILTSDLNPLVFDLPVLCESGQHWQWDHVQFDILSPEVGALSGENNNSCVLKVTSLYGSVLLTGDIEKSAETWLVENQGVLLDSDVMIAPHHGSKSSSSTIFLQQVSPDIVLIPSGYQNKFKFPHTEVTQRYDEMKALWRTTADEGALIVNIRPQGILLNSSRESQSKYWNN